MIEIIETPRDGMQGLTHVVPTGKKADYINALLRCGFHTVEVGSFVSPRAIPQMADTGRVLEKLELTNTDSNIAVLVANNKGGDRAVTYPQVDQLFYPFSLSPTFLKKNLNTTLDEGERTIDYLLNRCVATGKELVVFLSLAFGDPYGDDWSPEMVEEWVEKLYDKGITTIPLAETIGDVDADRIYQLCKALVPQFPHVTFGLHTHALPGQGIQKVDAAYRAGIRRFDTVLGGLGGCPMTGKEMIANLDLNDLIAYCRKQKMNCRLDADALTEAKRKLAGIVTL